MTQPAIAVFGGSFNPPHVGHVMVMSCALSLLPISQLWVVPCACHPFDKHLRDFQHRLEMIRLAARLFGDRVCVSDIEAWLPSPSYTLNTLKAIQVLLPDHKIFLLIGGDVWRERHDWHRFDLVEQMCEIVIFNRGEQKVGEARVLVDLPEIASTTIRDLLARGQPVDHILPLSVAEYCRKHGLYLAEETK